jgi:hypothetical protein
VRTLATITTGARSGLPGLAAAQRLAPLVVERRLARRQRRPDAAEPLACRAPQHGEAPGLGEPVVGRPQRRLDERADVVVTYLARQLADAAPRAQRFQQVHPARLQS